MSDVHFSSPNDNALVNNSALAIQGATAIVCALIEHKRATIFQNEDSGKVDSDKIAAFTVKIRDALVSGSEEQNKKGIIFAVV